MADTPKSSTFDPMDLPREARNPYPPPYDTVLNGRYRRAIGDAHGLTRFGVNLTEMEPGAVSALRHWHTEEDEFVYIVEGAPTLVTDAGEQELRAGMCACFPANSGDGHRLENRTDAVVRYLEVGNRSAGEKVHYPDCDLVMDKTPDGKRTFLHADGTPY